MRCIAQEHEHGSGRLVYNGDFIEVIRQNRLLDFDHVMALDAGEVVKHAVPERKTVKITLRDGDRHLGAFLKRTYPSPGVRCLKNLAGAVLPRTAYEEFTTIVAFHQAGLPTMTPVIAGTRRRGLFRVESFLVTLALTDCERLDHLLAAGRLSARRVKRRLIAEVACLVHQMHAAGFNHRDLYLCHVLRRFTGELFLADLHRVDRRRKVPERWLVKDIAALCYSAPRPLITATDRLWFLRNYFDAQKLSPQHKRFALDVLKKTDKMIRHNRKRTS